MTKFLFVPKNKHVVDAMLSSCRLYNHSSVFKESPNMRPHSSKQSKWCQSLKTPCSWPQLLDQGVYGNCKVQGIFRPGLSNVVACADTSTFLCNDGTRISLNCSWLCPWWQPILDKDPILSFHRQGKNGEATIYRQMTASPHYELEVPMEEFHLLLEQEGSWRFPAPLM